MPTIFDKMVSELQETLNNTCLLICKLINDKRIPDEVRKEIKIEISKIMDNWNPIK